MMAALREIVTQVYPDIPSVMNVPLLQKIRAIVSQEVLDKLSVRYRFAKSNQPSGELLANCFAVN